MKEITVQVNTTTGGCFDVTINEEGHVDELRWQIARKLQTPRDRLTLIHRESVLKSGKLKDHGISNGSRLTLLPNVESGFSPVQTSVHGTEQSVVQAIESLSDQQIDDFLSGRDPLTLALRVEDHMMFIQLQLEQQSKEKRKNQRQRVIKATSAPAPTSLSAKQQKPSTSSPSPPTSTQAGLSSKKNNPSTSTSTSAAVPKPNTTQPNTKTSQTNEDLLRKYCQQQPCLVIPNQHKLTNEISQIINAGNSLSRSSLPRIGISKPTHSNATPNTNPTTPINPSNAPKNGHAPTTSKIISHVSIDKKGGNKRSLLPPHNDNRSIQTRSQNHSQKPQTQKNLLKQKEDKAHIDTFTSHAPGIFSGTFSGMFNT
jgi:hypothetical protein